MSSPEGERSPKRRRISYSSASPSPTTAQTKQSQAQPQTPPLSDRMSPQQTLPGLGMQHGANGANGSVTFPTPPSTAGFQSQMLGRGGSSERGGVDSEQQTPAAIEADELAKKDGDGDQEMTDPALMEGETASRAEHRRTDHERQREDTTEPAPPIPGTGVLYKLSTDPPQPSSIPSSANLFTLYGLTDLQSTVARRDPITNEKINPLRKHYAGKVKQLGLEGKEKPLKKPEELMGLVDPGWSTKLPDGRTWWQDQRGDALLQTEDDGELALSKLDAALGGMRPGQMPRAEHEQWKNSLGLDESPAILNAPAIKQPPVPATARPPTAASVFLAKTAPGAAIRSSAPASPSRGAGRPERAGKKRRYDESSYEGYDQDDGYSTGGVDDTGGRRGSGGGKRQKRQKDFPSSSTANSPPFQSSGGGSMVGVKSS